jgi:hypothetical protein
MEAAAPLVVQQPEGDDSGSQSGIQFAIAARKVLKHEATHFRNPSSGI